MHRVLVMGTWNACFTVHSGSTEIYICSQGVVGSFSSLGANCMSSIAAQLTAGGCWRFLHALHCANIGMSACLFNRYTLLVHVFQLLVHVSST